ncbi:hypothetical protein ScPMuIL_013636 [Solemya velum]
MGSLPNGRQVCKLFCQPKYLQIVNKRGCARTHYEVLGIKSSASAQEVKLAFVELSKQLHPDLNRELDNHDKFVKLNESYSILSKPISRKEYDVSLRAKLRYQQSIQRAYGSHSYDSSMSPPSFDEKNGDYFWDETIWAMRDKSQDKYYESQPYYSIHGIKKLDNSMIVLGCLAFMAFFTLMSVTVIRDRRQKHKEMLDEEDRKNNLIHKKARMDAETYGTHMQLQMLKETLRKRREEKLVQTQEK